MRPFHAPNSLGRIRALQALDPLVLNGALVLMLGDCHAKVASIALDMIRLMHATTPVVDPAQPGLINGPGFVLFSDLVLQVQTAGCGLLIAALSTINSTRMPKHYVCCDRRCFLPAQLCHACQHKYWRVRVGACDAIALLCDLAPHRNWFLRFQASLLQACLTVLVSAWQRSVVVHAVDETFGQLHFTACIVPHVVCRRTTLLSTR